MAGKRKYAGPFIGDQILAAYQLIGSLCGLSVLSLLAVVCFGLAAKPSILTDLQKQYPGEAWRYLMDPRYTAVTGAILVLWIVWQSCWIIATWRGRKWALATHLILNGVGAALSVGFAHNQIAYIVPSVIAIYCLLRLPGNVGPKQAKRSRAETSSPRRRRARTA